MHTFVLKALVASATIANVVMASNSKLGAIVFKRQAFDPTETSGSGANWGAAVGEGYVECSDAGATENRLCINPSAGETCCDHVWGCPSESFCLIDGLCCPAGEDPATCAVDNSVTLPPGFTIPTVAPLSPASETAVASSTSVAAISSTTGLYPSGSVSYTASPTYANATITASATPSLYTGAASPLRVGIVGGVIGVFVGVVGMAGNML